MVVHPAAISRSVTPATDTVVQILLCGSVFSVRQFGLEGMHRDVVGDHPDRQCRLGVGLLLVGPVAHLHSHRHQQRRYQRGVGPDCRLGRDRLR